MARTSNQKKLVAVEVDEVVNVHLPHSSGNYYTLCGLDGMDEFVGQRIVPVPEGARVDCRDCLQIWILCHDFSKKYFDPDALIKTLGELPERKPRKNKHKVEHVTHKSPLYESASL